MNLLRFNYWEREPSGEEWEVEPLIFGKFNLIVGRNATGKTRILKAIARIAAVLSGETRVLKREFRYDLELDSQSADARLSWARLLQYLPFTARMNLRNPVAKSPDFLDVAGAYLEAQRKFGGSFEATILSRLELVGYPLESIHASTEAADLEVKQPGRHVNTPFRKLSQAQQRCLTFLTFLTLLELEKRAATLLIDDFAEGLDFESAIKLTKLLLELQSPLQFVVTSNDRYVMNTVPLEHWTVLVEDGQKTRVFNYHNSKQKFDDFKFTGLTNFDFFSMDFARSPA